ncbi:MAG: addiction module protein [Polyangiaceae bacterium]|nr:addiction module protein [Polyangiaceae bacterium]
MGRLATVPGSGAAGGDHRDEHGDAWEREIARRVAEVESGAVKTIPAAEVFAKAGRALAQRRSKRAQKTKR